jgi:hypothetical protein
MKNAIHTLLGIRAVLYRLLPYPLLFWTGFFGGNPSVAGRNK